MAGEEPIEIMNYTDNHFMNTLNHELENLRDNSRVHRWMENDSNSPINMSSDSDSDDCFEHGSIASSKHEGKPLFKKLTFREVQSSIEKYYETDDRYSSELDILMMYLKGQKQLYSKAVCIVSFKQYSILVSSAISSIALSLYLIIDDCPHPFVAGWNMVAIVLYFLNVWFQWGSLAGSYSLCSKQYDRFIRSMEGYCIDPELNNREQIHETLRNSEEKIREWKDFMAVELPTECKQFFPLLARVQIFTFIKRIETYKKNLILKFKDIKNEIRYIQWKGGELGTKEGVRFQFLLSIKEKIKNEILHYKNAYGIMEDLLAKEIQRTERFGWFLWSKRVPISDNPVVIAYLATIFEDD
jgi:hypothetical protein